MKACELREMTVEELEERLRESQAELFRLRQQKAGGQQMDNPLRLRLLRRDIARMKTILRERRKA